MKIDIANNKIEVFGNTLKTFLPLSTSFSQIEVLEDGELIVCEDYYNFNLKGKSNVYCLSRLLEIKWFLPLPVPELGDDWYVGLHPRAQEIFAITWSGHRVGINVKSGQITSIKFVKYKMPNDANFAPCLHISGILLNWLTMVQNTMAGRCSQTHLQFRNC